MTSISAVVASNNNESTIEKCLQSLTQNNLDEIILVDGDSHDRTLDIAQRFNVQMIKAERGIGKAKDAGWRRAKGELILFLDADAFIERHTVERLLPHLSEPNVAGVSCRVASANPHKLLARMRELDFFLAYSEEFKQFSVLECRADPTLCGLFTRRSLEDIDGFDVKYSYAEDLKLLEDMRAKGYRVLMVYEPAVFHYHRDNTRALFRQFYNHGAGRRAFRDEVGFGSRRKPWEIIVRIAKNARVFGVKGLICYPAYRCFTEAAFLMGYMHGVPNAGATA